MPRRYESRRRVAVLCDKPLETGARMIGRGSSWSRGILFANHLAIRQAVARSSVPDKPVILGVRADPEPCEIGPVFDGHGPIMQADTDRPEASNAFQVKRGMSRVLTK